MLVLGLSVAEEFGSSRLCLRACLRPRLHPCPRLRSRAQVVMSVLHSFFFSADVGSGTTGENNQLVLHGGGPHDNMKRGLKKPLSGTDVK